MDSCDDTPKGWVAPFGHPRINACSRLSVAFRSVPRPSSPPGAKASTECPSLAQDLSPAITGSWPGDASGDLHHAQKPSSAVINHQEMNCASRSLLLSTQQSSLNTIPSRRRCTAPGQTRAPNKIRDSRWLRPETYQNLIHPDKDRRSNRRHLRQHGFLRNPRCRLLSLLRDMSPTISTPPKWWR